MLWDASQAYGKVVMCCLYTLMTEFALQQIADTTSLLRMHC
jgi:hypothetical protein